MTLFPKIVPFIR